MQLKFFIFSVLDIVNAEEDINKFLKSAKVLEIKKELVHDGDRSYWAICILYLESAISDNNVKNKIDYKDRLSEVEFKLFCKLRTIRKQLADEDAVPAFAVFTDYELSEIAKLPEIAISTIKKIKGIGSKKIEKYGKKFCDMVTVSENEEDRQNIP
ncbi:MAG: HRDC domain-containing protein [Muribaculaceae bacterium]|nr:HRDC domain-containing protein [Muribaculaceae bacterium]